MTADEGTGQTTGEPEAAPGTTEAMPPPPPPAPSYPPPAPPPGYGYGGPSSRPGFYLDAASGLFLPEGVVLAGQGRRIAAGFLSPVLFLVTLGIGWLIWGLVVWGRGQTPALQVLGMRCWRPGEDRVAGWGWMALRNIVGRFVEGILNIISLLVSFILMLATPKRQSLHDLIGGTVVLHDPNGVLG
jgi:uncharacterized RDD family membrane protein YckC